MSKVRSIRASEEEWARWAEAAKAEGSDLTSWIRDAANEAAGREDPNLEMLRQLQAIRKSKPSKNNQVSGQCSRWMHHRKGTFCGSCNKTI